MRRRKRKNINKNPMKINEIKGMKSHMKHRFGQRRVFNKALTYKNVYYKIDKKGLVIFK